MMGAGKSTVGRQLAAQLNYTFIDLDDYLEAREGRTIARIFEQEGQESFRKKERQALEAVVQEYKQAVVATGGGAPCFFDNMSFMNQHGTSVFLDVSVEEIVARLQKTNLATRPLLTGKSTEELKEFIGQTLISRRQYYEQAKHQVPVQYQSIAALSTILNLP
ncbi:shikimate kinase [Pontibacter sp. SGAir0037]|nr:shikimate kinase [Pontibacter sp. SGAir0037]